MRSKVQDIKGELIKDKIDLAHLLALRSSNSASLISPYASLNGGNLDSKIAEINGQISADESEISEAERDDNQTEGTEIVLLKAEQKQQKFRNKHKHDIAEATKEGSYDYSRLSGVTKLLLADADYAKSSGLGHSSISDPDLMCIGGKCLDPRVQQMMADNPEKYKHNIRLGESADNVRLYLQNFKYVMPLTPEQATEITKNDPNLVKEAEIFVDKRSEETGQPLKHKFHLNEFMRDTPPEERKIIRGILEDPDKCMSGKAVSCSVKDHEARLKYAKQIEEYKKEFIAKYPNSQVPWKESEYDLNGNKIAPPTAKIADNANKSSADSQKPKDAAPSVPPTQVMEYAAAAKAKSATLTA